MYLCTKDSSACRVLTHGLAIGNTRILHNLHCEAVSQTLDDQCSGLTQVFEFGGRASTSKLLEELMPFLTFGESRAPLQFADDKTVRMDSGDGPSRHEALVEVISQLLRLKLHLTLSNCQYEFYLPTGQSIDESRYLAPEAHETRSSCEIEYCVSPALLEYSTEVPSTDSNDRHLVGSTNFSRKTDSERGKSRVVFPAEVTYHV